MEVRGLVLVPVRVEASYQSTPVVELSVVGQRGGVAYGRHRSRSSSLVASGARIQGLRGELRLGRVDVEFLQGETHSASEGRLDAETGEVASWGRYRRTVSNLNVRTALTPGLKGQMSVSRGEDDAGSIVYGLDREDNLAAGGELEYSAGRSRVNASLGASRTGTEGVSRMLAHRSGMAWEVEGRTTLAGHKLEAETYSVDRGHQSFAGYSRTNDRRGFGMADKFYMMNKKVSMGLGYDQYRDNLDGIDESTVITRKPWMKATISPNASMPRVSVSARLTKNSIEESGGQFDESSMATTVALSRTWKYSRTTRLSPELGVSYFRRRATLGSGEATRVLFAGAETRLGANEASVRLGWSERNHETPGLDRSELSLELRQEIAAGNRFRFTGRETYEALGYEDGSRQNRLDLQASLAFQLVPERISLSGNYRYRDTRMENEEWDDVTAGHGLFVAVTATESVRVLGRR
jgi:hypothetical protein